VSLTNVSTGTNGSNGANGSPDARLADSFAFCRDLTRDAAKNFYYGLRLLPEPKRSAMYALYAYMRLVDDIADHDDGGTVEQRTAALERWKLRTHAALAGDVSDVGEKIWPAFAHTVERFQIPPHLFDDAIAGQQRDLVTDRFENFEQLHRYCYQVAGVVGLASIHIWGFVGGEETEKLAMARGVALQLTNILRDIREDASHGRIYFPREDLRRLNVAEADLLAGKDGDAFRSLMRFQIERAESFYVDSKPLEARISPDSRPTLVAMTEIYHRLLRKISADPASVLRERVSLSVWSKLKIGWRAVKAARSARSSRGAREDEDAAVAAP
jgi:phytoene synthase